MQTLNPKFARLLNRECTTEYAKEILQEVRQANWPSWSIDLIFALPEQTLTDLNQDLDAILSLDVPHVSLYGLTWEQGTPFARALAHGRMHAIDDDLWRKQYDLIRDRLLSNGYLQYEVSNFAKPGHESRHNSLYWSDAPYVGLGPSAHGYRPDGTRTQHVADVHQYMNHPEVQTHLPTRIQHAVDMLISGLRSTVGIHPRRLLAKSGHTIESKRIHHLVTQGLITMENGRIIPTHDGFPVSDAIVEYLIHGLVAQTDQNVPLLE